MSNKRIEQLTFGFLVDNTLSHQTFNDVDEDKITRCLEILAEPNKPVVEPSKTAEQKLEEDAKAWAETLLGEHLDEDEKRDVGRCLKDFFMTGLAAYTLDKDMKLKYVDPLSPEMCEKMSNIGRDGKEKPIEERAGHIDWKPPSTYYMVEPEDVFIGLEMCEDTTVHEGNIIHILENLDFYKVKCLDKADITSLGFTISSDSPSNSESIWWSFKSNKKLLGVGSGDDRVVTLDYDVREQTIYISYLENRGDDYLVVDGITVKNKSELKRLLKNLQMGWLWGRK